MIFPEFLYALTARDEQITPLEAVEVTQTTVATAATLQANLFNRTPNDRILILGQVAFKVTPAAGITLLRVLLGLNRPNDIVLRYLFARTYQANAAGVVIQDGEFSQIIIPPNSLVFAFAEFSAAGATDSTLEATVTGVMFPRGNFAL